MTLGKVDPPSLQLPLTMLDIASCSPDHLRLGADTASEVVNTAPERPLASVWITRTHACHLPHQLECLSLEGGCPEPSVEIAHYLALCIHDLTREETEALPDALTGVPMVYLCYGTESCLDDLLLPRLTPEGGLRIDLDHYPLCECGDGCQCALYHLGQMLPHWNVGVLLVTCGDTARVFYRSEEGGVVAYRQLRDTLPDHLPLYPVWQPQLRDPEYRERVRRHCEEYPGPVYLLAPDHVSPSSLGEGRQLVNSPGGLCEVYLPTSGQR